MGALYSTKVFVSGGREGHAKSDDEILDIKLTPPKELRGQGGATNPEQLTICPYSKAIQGNVDVKLSAKAK